MRVSPCSVVTYLLFHVLMCVFMLHRVPLHFRVSPETRQRLQRLRTERHLNVGAWLRTLIDEALDREFGPAPTDANELAAPVKAAPPEPIPGWTPARLEGGVWGVRFQGDTRTLPTNLEGLTIAVETRSGDSWNATVTEVLERSANLVLVHAQNSINEPVQLNRIPGRIRTEPRPTLALCCIFSGAVRLLENSLSKWTVLWGEVKIAPLTGRPQRPLPWSWRSKATSATLLTGRVAFREITEPRTGSLIDTSTAWFLGRDGLR